MRKYPSALARQQVFWISAEASLDQQIAEKKSVTNVEVLTRAYSDSIHTHLYKMRLRWIGNVRSMENDRLAKKILYGEIQRGKRKVGRPLQRYSDSVEQDMNRCNITNWEENAENRGIWRQVVRDGCKVIEAEWRNEEEERRIWRQNRRSHHEQ